MKRKYIIGAVVLFLGIAVCVVLSGGKMPPGPKRGAEAMTVVVELPRTNAANSPTSPEVKYRRQATP